jgi:hypothetical protein
MRLILSAALITMLSACDAVPSNELADSGPSILERLRSGDTTVCADPEVQTTMMAVAAGGDMLEKFLALKRELPRISAVSATDINDKIAEVSCSGNVDVPEVGLLLSAMSGSIAWKVRPALDQDGYIVEIPAAGLTETVSAFRRYVTYSVTIAEAEKREREQPETTAAEPDPDANISMNAPNAFPTYEDTPAQFDTSNNIEQSADQSE